MESQASTEVAISGNQDVASLAPFIIGVAGGTASGKTSVCRKIMEQLRKDVPVSLTHRGSSLQQCQRLCAFDVHFVGFVCPRLSQCIVRLQRAGLNMV